MPNRRARETRAEVQAQRAFQGKRHTRKRLPRQIYPKGIQLAYARALRSIVREAIEQLQPLLDDLPALVQSAASDRERLDAGEGRRVSELIAAAQERLAGTLDTRALTTLAARFATQTEAWQRLQMGKQVRAAFGVDVLASDAGVAAAAEAFTAENVSLIKNLPQKMYDEIEQLVQREIPRGTLHKDLAKQVQERFGIAERRAKLIARDQVGKYYGKVNEVRQRNLGVERFIWRTANDERVRPEHSARDGNVYTWADAPEGGPGQPINCRCYPEPVLADVIG